MHTSFRHIFPKTVFPVLSGTLPVGSLKTFREIQRAVEPAVQSDGFDRQVCGQQQFYSIIKPFFQDKFGWGVGKTPAPFSI